MKLYFDFGTLYIMEAMMNEIKTGGSDVKWTATWNDIALKYAFGVIPLRKL